MFRPLAAALMLLLLTAPLASAAPSTNPADMPAGTYVIDKGHSSLIARVRHVGLSAYTVRFTGFDATYSYDPKAPAASKVEATIQAATLDTGTDKYNAEFADKFLDAGANPTIRFVSTAITPGAGNTGTITGDLTFRGVTKPVTLDVTFDGYTSGITGQRSGFSARGTIKRSDFGSTFLLNPPLAMVGDDVELILEVEFVKQ
ncbi:MAG: YceI family protein [Caulobacterales bacterium]|nr:YceI family protein [Caulobacterales bacterium]